MKIPGTTKVQLSLLTILAISSVLSTGLQIHRTIGTTSEENISYKKENQKVEKEELQVRVTGRNIIFTQNPW